MTTSRVREGTKPGTVILEITIDKREFNRLSSKAEAHSESVASMMLSAYRAIAPKPKSEPVSREPKSDSDIRVVVRSGLADNKSLSAIAKSIGVTYQCVSQHKKAIAKQAVDSQSA